MKDFAKSIRTGNKAIYDDSGKFIIGYVEKNGDKYSAYTHGITGSKSYLLDAKDEKTAEAELKDYVKAYEKRTGNSRIGNEATVLKDGNVWVVLYANETKSKEFDTEAEARAFAKQVGNSKVGNFMHDAKGQVEDMITLSERLVSQGNKERAKDVLGTMEIIFRQLNADKEEYYQKYKESDELISKLKRAAIKLKSIV